MRRTKTMLLGDVLEDFFSQPYVAAKVAEGKLPETWPYLVEHHPLGAFLPPRCHCRRDKQGEQGEVCECVDNQIEIGC